MCFHCTVYVWYRKTALTHTPTVGLVIMRLSQSNVTFICSFHFTAPLFVLSACDFFFPLSLRDASYFIFFTVRSSVLSPKGHWVKSHLSPCVPENDTALIFTVKPLWHVRLGNRPLRFEYQHSPGRSAQSGGARVKRSVQLC